MTMTNTVDAARVELLLSELRLPGVKLMWAKLAEQSDKEGWPAARFLAETNNDPKPFTWTANPDRIIAAVRRGHQVLDSIH